MKRTLILLSLLILVGVVYCLDGGARELRLRGYARKWLLRADGLVTTGLHGLGLVKELAPQALEADTFRDNTSETGRSKARQPLRIWPIGDSITEGLSGYSSYRYWLYKLLKQSNYDFVYVGTKSGTDADPQQHSELGYLHNSYAGYRADDVALLLKKVARVVSFDVALVHLGTNDLGWGESPEEIISDLEEIIKVLRQRNSKCTIFLAQIIPVAGGISRFVALNQLIPKLANKLSTDDSKILVVNQFEGFDPASDTYDSVHPTQEGEQKIAARWFEALSQIF